MKLNDEELRALVQYFELLIEIDQQDKAQASADTSA